MKHEEDIDNQDIEDVKPQLRVEEHVKNGQVKVHIDIVICHKKNQRFGGIIINVEIQIMNQVEYGVIQQIQKKDGNFVSYIKLILKIYII